MKQSNYIFKVNTIEGGQRGSYQDSYYSYEVISNRAEHEVKAFCMNVLKKSYASKDMPNAFAGELLEFKNITNNNEGKDIFCKRVEETYSYKSKTLYTG